MLEFEYLSNSSHYYRWLKRLCLMSSILKYIFLRVFLVIVEKSETRNYNCVFLVFRWWMEVIKADRIQGNYTIGENDQPS
jgi:hypothetical protein